MHPHDPHNRVTADGTNDPTAFAKLDVQIWNSNRFRLAAKSIYRAVSLWQRRNLSSMRDSRPTSRCTHSWKRNGIDVNVFVTRRDRRRLSKSAVRMKFTKRNIFFPGRNFKLEVFYPTLDVIIFIILEQKLGLSANLAFIRRTDSSSGRRVPINYRCWHCVPLAVALWRYRYRLVGVMLS